MSERSVTVLLVALLAVMTCLPILRSWYTSNDDLNISLGVQMGEKMGGYEFATHTGRLQHVFTGQLIPLAYGFGSYWATKSLAIAAILSNVVAMFFALRMVTGSPRLATLAVVFFFAFIQNTHDHSLFTSYPFILPATLTLFWLSLMAWWAALQGRRWMRLASLALFACCLVVYENFIVYAAAFPVLTLAAATGPWRDRIRRAALTPHVPLMLAFVVAVVAFRYWHHSDIGRYMMGVENYYISLDVPRALKVIERYGSSAFPLHYARLYRTLVTDYYMGYGLFRVKLFEIFEVLEAAFLVKAVIAAFLTAVLLGGRDAIVRHRGVLAFLAFVFLVLTNLPLAFTAKYQIWVNDFLHHGYLTAYFAFFGVVILLVLLADGLVALAARRSRTAARAAAGFFAVAAFFVTYGVDLINAHVAFTDRQMYDRWQIVDKWIEGDGFRAMPAGSLVLAPSLFEHYPGTVHVFEDYWTRYVSHHGGKRVEMLHTREAWMERVRATDGAPRLYYFRFMQEKRGDSSFIVFAPVTSGDRGFRLGSSQVTILTRARADRFRITGRLSGGDAGCRSRVFVDGVPTSGTFTGAFGAHVDRWRDAQEWLWTRLSTDGAALDPESIAIAASEAHVDGAVEVLPGAGFHPDESAPYRWSTQPAVVTLRNREDRLVPVDLMFDIQTPGAGKGSAQLTAAAGSVQQTWSVGAGREKRSMRIEVPPLASVDVQFTTDAPQVHAPTDPRKLVMQFWLPMQAYEPGCERADNGN
jgi:hypothetical protein